MVRANGAGQRCLLFRCNCAKQLRKLHFGIDRHLSAEKLRSRERWLELIELAIHCLKDVTELNSCGSYALKSTDISVHNRGVESVIDETTLLTDTKCILGRN